MSGIPHKFKIASISDKEAILLFLKEQWDENHIYLKSNILFDYDFLINDKINFIIAINEKNEIDGILGFILYSPEFHNSDICTVLWKVRPKNGNPALGMTLLTSLVEDFGFRAISTVGANKRTLPIYQFLGYSVGKLAHYFMLNDRIEQHNILKNVPVLIPAISNHVNEKKLVRYDTYEDLTLDFKPESYSEYAPFKSAWYINRRYFNHPIYNYAVWGISCNGIVDSIIIAREVQVKDSKILRIVDFLGEASGLTFITGQLKDMLYANHYEYLDFYQFGIEHDLMEKAGFLLKDDYNELIIPNYFEPFEYTNVDINFFTTASDKFRIFKGDGDQDRPNILL